VFAERLVVEVGQEVCATDVQRIPENGASWHNGLPSKKKTDPGFPGSAAICLSFGLPSNL
jgi:hypothetical protein